MWCDIMRYDKMWWDVMRYHEMWCDMMWYDILWWDMIRYDVIWCDGLEVRTCIQASICHCITIEGGSFGEKELDIYNLKVGTVKKKSILLNF